MTEPELIPIELPVLGAPIERSDAARNRQLILAAAEALFERDGVSCTSMDAIASEAGVGKGTLFRRFGDRASLVFALLDSVEREFQDSFISGPPPLGPGAPPAERLIAFGDGILEHIATNGDLLLGAQSAGAPIARFDAGPYGAYRVHLTMLIREAAPHPRRRVHRRGAAHTPTGRGRPLPAPRARDAARAPDLRLDGTH